MGKYVVQVQLRFNDMDGLGHVNNAAYLTFLEHARMRFFTEEAGSESEKDFPFILAHASIDYKTPIKMGAQLQVSMWTSRVGGKSWDFDYEIKDTKTATVYATAKTVQVAFDYQLERSDMLDGDLKELILDLRP